MSEKDEALKHLSAIKSVLVDKDSFFPYNYNALILWGVIGMVLTLTMVPLLERSIFTGTIFSVILFTIGFVVEGFLTKRVNADYDIEDCTHRQRFIVTMFAALTLFGVVMTAVLAKQSLYLPIYTLWIFLCGLGNHAVGFVLNIKLFKISSFMEIVASILLLIAIYFIGDMSDTGATFYYFVQGVTFALLGVMPIMIGRKLKEEV
jgi:uncharacterized membrane protein